MTNEQKHTPTPWEVGKSVSGTPTISTASRHLGQMFPMPEMGDNDVAHFNAAHIVHCVNNFDALTAERDRLREANAELVGSLKTAVRWIKIWTADAEILPAMSALIAKHSPHGQEKGG